jgi:hypothetical protein
MESVHALLAAQAADAIVGFLHQVHNQERATLPGARLVFEDSEAFNNYVDDANQVVQIFDLEYRPSEVLFNVDFEAYRELLSSYELESPEGDTESKGTPS